MRVAQMSESELIRRFEEILPSGDRTLLGIGDDCAQVASPEGSFVVTTDVIVEDQHFHRAWSDPEQIGARIAAQNLSDIASMGGRTSALVVTLVLTPDTEVEWLMRLVSGLGERARAAGAGVVGGDLSAGEKMVLSITAMGWCEADPITRSGARPGDVLAAAGPIGLSYAGLDLLLGGHIDPAVRDEASMGVFADALNAYRAPTPPLEAGPAAAAAGVHAMMDLSDGIAMDGGRMARASGVVIELDEELLEVHAQRLRPVADMIGADPLRWVLGGGEDQGMLAAFGPDTPLPDGYAPLGTIRAPRDGERPAILFHGRELHGLWDHFAND
ncbi:thiamine-phosphate kinase [Actinomyces sp. B33]|uniref:thiamine-phosphate kinase n=1 Tax=Actinomyces sp. B33 TaxID=2942131 RepID=UPI0023413EB4|nr:thiamine-phosphate kinase [Actinomyces sp. B33]MDC4233107.1 thiamine-phosphate kinase [Actinomyces sp. B33]